MLPQLLPSALKPAHAPAILPPRAQFTTTYAVFCSSEQVVTKRGWQELRQDHGLRVRHGTVPSGFRCQPEHGTNKGDKARAS